MSCSLFACPFRHSFACPPARALSLGFRVWGFGVSSGRHRSNAGDLMLGFFFRGACYNTMRDY